MFDRETKREKNLGPGQDAQRPSARTACRDEFVGSGTSAPQVEDLPEHDRQNGETFSDKNPAGRVGGNRDV